MNKDKIIKDLKKRNDSLKMQYEYRNIRCVHLEIENERLQQENQQLKKQKDKLETSYDILQKNNITLVKQKEEAYKIADDYYKENQQLKKQKDDIVEYIKKQNKFIRGCDIYQPLNKDIILRMLGEIDEQNLQR